MQAHSERNLVLGNALRYQPRKEGYVQNLVGNKNFMICISVLLIHCLWLKIGFESTRILIYSKLERLPTWRNTVSNRADIRDEQLTGRQFNSAGISKRALSEAERRRE